MGSADGGPVRCALLLRRAGKESLSDALAVFCPKGAADQSGLRSGYVAAAKLRGCYVAVDRSGLRSGYPTV
jgi:hypothetical protein